MTSEREKFGAFIRREREAREIGLREMAKKIGVSPTYMSKVERDEFTPPTEDKVRSIAQIIECDPDELLAMAGRVPSDLADIIKRQSRRNVGAAANRQRSERRRDRPTGAGREEGQRRVKPPGHGPSRCR